MSDSNEILLEDEIKKHTEHPTVVICIYQNPQREIHIWTYKYANQRYLLIAKLVDNSGKVYRAWADSVRDYIDMTHLRNWILNDCKDVMDSKGRLLLEQFMKRYKYERSPELTQTYVAIR